MSRVLIGEHRRLCWNCRIDKGSVYALDPKDWETAEAFGKAVVEAKKRQIELLRANHLKHDPDPKNIILVYRSYWKGNK